MNITKYHVIELLNSEFFSLKKIGIKWAQMNQVAPENLDRVAHSFQSNLRQKIKKQSLKTNSKEVVFIFNYIQNIIK